MQRIPPNTYLYLNTNTLYIQLTHSGSVRHGGYPVLAGIARNRNAAVCELQVHSGGSYWVTDPATSKEGIFYAAGKRLHGEQLN